MIGGLRLHDLIGKNVRVTRKAGDSWTGILESVGNFVDDGPCGKGNWDEKVVILIKTGITITFRLEEVESVEEEMKA